MYALSCLSKTRFTVEVNLTWWLFTPAITLFGLELRNVRFNLASCTFALHRFKGELAEYIIKKYNTDIKKI